MTTVLSALVAALAAGGGVAMIARHRRRMDLVEIAAALGESTTEVPSVPQLRLRVERAARGLQRHDVETARAQRRMEHALSSMTQGAVICDDRGDVVLRNSFAQSFVDARHGDALVGAAIDELLDEARTGVAADREVDLFGPPRRTLFVHAAPLYEGDDLLGAIATVDDITEQQRIDAIRRDFVANISHELKTPVGALALLAETLSDEEDSGVVRRLAGRMRDESFRVSRVIDDLLALSHIEGEGVQSLERVRLSAVVSEAVDRIRPAAELQDVRIDVADVSPELEMLGDRRQLTSALFNLLENAVKYSDCGSVVEVRAAGDGNEAALVVQDHGIGIPAKDLQRIFERFYRVDQARSRQTGGTGLGLAIVRHVARNHGGDVTVSSREGEGSTFMLVLPTGLDATTTPTEAHLA
jgi:two-component system sensor histidine kinase SenX3